MSDIFISYAKEDRARVVSLAQAIEAFGWSVFWDRNIRAGRDWRDVMSAELDQAKCIIVIWSKTSIQSRWVREEADVGQERRILVPALIDQVPPVLGFRTLQAADLIDWDGQASAPPFRRLLDDIASLIGSPQREVRAREQPLEQSTAGQPEPVEWKPKPVEQTAAKAPPAPPEPPRQPLQTVTTAAAGEVAPATWLPGAVWPDAAKSPRGSGSSPRRGRRPVPTEQVPPLHTYRDPVIPSTPLSRKSYRTFAGLSRRWKLWGALAVLAVAAALWLIFPLEPSLVPVPSVTAPGGRILAGPRDSGSVADQERPAVRGLGVFKLAGLQPLARARDRCAARLDLLGPAFAR